MFFFEGGAQIKTSIARNQNTTNTCEPMQPEWRSRINAQSSSCFAILTTLIRHGFIQNMRVGYGYVWIIQILIYNMLVLCFKHNVFAYISKSNIVIYSLHHMQ